MDIIRDAVSGYSFTNSTPPIHFDPYSEAFHKDPHSVYKMLRNIAPVAYWEAGKAWLATDYGNVVSILTDNRFTPDISTWVHYEKAAAVEDSLVTAIKKKLLAIGGSDRRQLLLATKPILSAKNRKMLNTMSEAADEVIQRISARPGFDLVLDFAHPLSIKIITRLLGIPEKYVAILIRFVRASIEILDPAASYSSMEIHHRVLRIKTGLDLIDRTIMERKQGKLGELLIDELFDMQVDGQVLSNANLTSLIGLLIFSALDCLSLLITNSAFSILSHPKTYKALRENSTLWSNAIKETIRHDHFIKLGTPRYAVESCNLANQTIGKGERVYPIIAAAMRDPAVFGQPDELDIMRPLEKFIGFGHGAYVCIGQSLALLAAEISSRKLIESVYPLTVVDGPLYDQSHKTFRMICSLKLARGNAEIYMDG